MRTFFLKNLIFVLLFYFSFLVYRTLPGASGFDYDRKLSKSDSLVIDSIIMYGKTFLGKPYQFQTEDKKMLDCSGFVSYIFRPFGFKVPTAATAIADVVNKISLDKIKKGDFLFFKGRDKSKSSVGHISMVISDTLGKIKMMHSCSRGIIIENYNRNSYYTERFLFAGRLPAFEVFNQNPESEKFKESSGKIIISDSLRITGVGDIMLGTNYPSSSYLPPEDGKRILDPVKEIIGSADIAFGNLEGVILSGEGNVKSCSDPSVCYAFKMPDHYVNYLKEAGFDLLSLANNHSNDFGAIGVNNTMKVLKKAEIQYAGLSSCPTAIFSCKNLKIGFAAFAPNNGTVNINDLKAAQKIVRGLDSVCDLVIVSFHGGAEGGTKNHITRETENFLGENRGNPYKFARTVIDAGADIVFGHGPHVPRAVDMYKGRFIAYSMGNFATYGRFNLKTNSGYAPIIDIYVNSKGEFMHGKIHSFVQLGEGGPVADADKKVIKEISSLSKMDIPESPIEITSEGNIIKKP
jgi:poly-gamma-glutamate capsule biosynthesis protein CapA/YwtB (metallophosphatase superfamily)